MLSSEKREFNAMLMQLFETYYKEPSPSMYATWFSVMKEYSLDDIGRAMSAYAAKEKYPPVPASVIDMISSRPRELMADEAWEWAPKLGSETGYVTKKMMQALGTAEESLVTKNYIGAKIAFVNTYNSLPADNKFYYSGGYNGLSYGEKEQRKIEDYKKLEGKNWLPKEKMLMLKPSELLMIENDTGEAISESSKERGKKSTSIILDMLKKKKSTG